MNEKFVFHWSLFSRFQLKLSIIGLDNGLALPRQAIIWSNADPIHWRIYAALAGDELTTPFSRLTCRRIYNIEYGTENVDNKGTNHQASGMGISRWSRLYQA